MTLAVGAFVLMYKTSLPSNTVSEEKADSKIVNEAKLLARTAPEKLSSKHVEHVLLDLLSLFGSEPGPIPVTERDAWPLVRVLVAYEKWLLPVVGDGLMLFSQQEGSAADVLALCSDEKFFEPIQQTNDPAPDPMAVSGFGVFHQTFLENCSAVAFNPSKDKPYLVEGNSEAAFTLFTRVANAVVLEKHLLAGPKISRRSAMGDPPALTFLNVIHGTPNGAAEKDPPLFPMPSPDMSVFVEYPFAPKDGAVGAWTGIDRIQPWPTDPASLAEIPLIELAAATKNEKLRIAWNPTRSS